MDHETDPYHLRRLIWWVREQSFCSADVVEAINSLYNRGLINYNDAREIAAAFAVEWE